MRANPDGLVSQQDTLQHTVEAGVDTVVFEIREASRRAGKEHGPEAGERDTVA